MGTLVSSVVTLLAQLLPLISGNSPVIATVIQTLVSLIPALVQEAETLVPIVKNIIAALSADPATTADQLATLQALDAQCDQAFESAAVDASVDNPAPAAS